jgi:hypothetical protein
MSGDRIVKLRGPFVVVDVTHDMDCFVEIAPKRDRRRGLGDAIATTVIGGVRPDRRGEPPSTIMGDFCTEISINGEVVWHVEQSQASRPNVLVREEDLLHSDCRYRLDRGYFIQGRMEEADGLKLGLEALQRREEEIRNSRRTPEPRKPPEEPPAKPDTSPFAGFMKLGGLFSRN